MFYCILSLNKPNFVGTNITNYRTVFINMTTFKICVLGKSHLQLLKIIIFTCKLLSMTPFNYLPKLKMSKFNRFVEVKGMKVSCLLTKQIQRHPYYSLSSQMYSNSEDS
uniref:Uncharacterized protein n=1 Tax=Micrurus corallinus TaxID=54390 RepID=A0A2D4GR73_MICCO